MWDAAVHRVPTQGGRVTLTFDAYFHLGDAAQDVDAVFAFAGYRDGGTARVKLSM
jgi:hypothetical protein